MSGAWDGNTFTNEWANIKLTLPEDWIVVPEEQIQKFTDMSEQNADNLTEEDGITKEDIENLHSLSVRDFMVLSKNGPAVLLAEYVDYSSFSASFQMTAEHFLNGKKEFSEKNGVEFVELPSVIIAGEKYLTAVSHSPDLPTDSQVFVRVFDGAIINFHAIYPPELKQDIDALIASIEEAH
jgi:hypothetical protein